MISRDQEIDNSANTKIRGWSVMWTRNFFLKRELANLANTQMLQTQVRVFTLLIDMIHNMKWEMLVFTNLIATPEWGFPIFLMYQRCSQRCSTINQFSDMLFMILSSSALKGFNSHNLFNFASTSTFSSPPYYNTIYNNIRVLPSVAGFEMKLSRHISHYLITYYLPSGDPLIIWPCWW